MEPDGSPTTMASDEPPEAIEETWIPEAIVGLGAALLIVHPGTQVILNGPGVLLAPSFVLGFAIAASFAVPLMYGGYWLRRSHVAADRYPRVGAWCLVGMVGFLGVNLVMIAAWPGPTLAFNVGWAVGAAAMGAGGGMLFGGIEARAIERAREAERAAMRSAHLERQREWLEYLNGLLRHEVLNTANVIAGYAELLMEDLDGDEQSRERLARVERQSRKMTEVIQDVRVLIQATKQDVTFETVDVVSVLEAEITALEDRHDDVAVTTAWPESAHVTADDLLARIFSNLLDNAVVHNDSPGKRVRIDVEADPATVTVSVADNGPGVPADARRTLFERSGRGDHGFGLYLVRTLLTRYDGTIELEETGSDGSTFVVELPRASAAPATAGDTRTLTVDAV